MMLWTISNCINDYFLKKTNDVMTNFVFVFIHNICVFHNLWNYIVKFVEGNFLNKLCVVWYSCCISQFMFLCCLILILENIFEFIQCDMTWIKYKFVLRGQNHLIFTCDNWKLMIRKSKYDYVLVWNHILKLSF
jgi:hypothetical protein